MASRQKLCICNTWIFFPDGRTPHESDSQRRHDCKLWKNGQPIVVGSHARVNDARVIQCTTAVASVGSLDVSSTEFSSRNDPHCVEKPAIFERQRHLDGHRRAPNLVAFLLVLTSCMLLTSGFLAWAYSRMVTAQ